MEEKRSKKEIIILVVRILLALGLALLGKLYLNESNFEWYVNLIVMGAAYLIIAYDIIAEAIEHIFKDHEFFDENALMVFASVGAFALRAYGPDHNEYLEGVLVILLYQVGEVFEDLAADKSREAITSALDLRKEKAKVIDGDSVIEKTPEELSIGDIVMIGSGMKVLCDGEVLEGSGETDESSLTGEFDPVGKSVGDIVFSGTILKSGSLKIRVKKEYKDSTVAKMLDLVENSAEKKSKSTRFITRFAKIYTPIVVATAVLVAVLPPLFLGISDPGTWAAWLYTALSFLVVSCPCAIVISVPLAYFSGLGLASKQGILVKGAGYFDEANALRYVAFDKTGTLTKGQFHVEKVSPKGMGKELFLEYLAAAESNSSHPIAKAIVAASAKEDLIKEVSSYEEVAGYGVKASYKGHALLAGKIGLLRNNGIEAEEVEGAATYLSVDGAYAGYVLMMDTLKDNSAKVVADLHALGKEAIMLSGDKNANVEAIAKQIKLDEWHGELLPAEKTELVQSIIDRKAGALAYVGDGINDAPSIVLSDIGVAMGGLGSDVAVANADVVIMNDDPYKVVTFLKIAKVTRNRAIFNIAFSLAVKAGIMIAAVIAAAMGTWELPLWVSILGDTGVALLAVLSSLLLQFKKIK